MQAYDLVDSVLAAVVLCPLSMGPVLKTCDAEGLYAPIFYLTRVLPGSFDVVQVVLWAVESDPDPDCALAKLPWHSLRFAFQTPPLTVAPIKR